MPRPRKPIEEQGEPGRKRCPGCRKLVPTASRRCPRCGHWFAPKQPFNSMEVLESIQRMGRYVQAAGSRERALELARQLKWLHERMGGWDQLLQALDATVRISEGTSEQEAAG